MVTITGKEIEIENIKPTDTVYRIKEKFEVLQGIPPPQQRYIACGKVLKDSQTVEDLSMREGSKIHLILHNCVPFDHGENSGGQ